MTRDEFLTYFDRVRSRTMKVAALAPPDEIDWACRPGAFTLGDTIRHIAVTERYMWAETASGRPSRYLTHGPELARTHADVISLATRLHAESMAIFRALTPEQFDGLCQTPAGAPIAVWKWLRTMIEHEVHHRGQIYLMLGMLGVETPPIFGLTSEELRRSSS